MTWAVLVLAGLLAASSVAEAHPASVAPDAARYRRQIVGEWRRVWGLWADPSVAFGQIHQESRFRPDARSKYAAGLAQFTPPTAADMQRWYPAELREECTAAGGCPLSPGWAIRSLCLFDRRLWLTWGAAATEDDRWGFTLASYNAGRGWISREAREAPARGLDGARWREHVERVCVRARWACEESAGYVVNILHRWAPLYQEWLRW